MITFKKKELADQISLVEITTFENEIGYTFPEDYKQHMLKYNGGQPVNFETHFEDSEDEIRLSYFYALNSQHTSLNKMYVSGSHFLPSGYISMGATGTGSLAMDLNNDSKGAIYVYYSDGELEFLANSFTEFLEGLKEYPEGYFD